MDKYKCTVCGYVYDPAIGDPEGSIPPGTAFDDLPDDYKCPVCGLDVKITKSFGKVGKEAFGPLDA